MKKIYKENLLGKRALLWAMSCAFDLNRGCGTGNLWENNIRFNFDGHKCKLLSVDEMDYEKGTIIMAVLAKGKELKEWTDIRLNFVATHFHYETLYKSLKNFICAVTLATMTLGATMLTTLSRTSVRTGLTPMTRPVSVGTKMEIATHQIGGWFSFTRESILRRTVVYSLK